MTRTQLEGSVLAGRRQDRGSSTGAEKANCNIEKKDWEGNWFSRKGKQLQILQHVLERLCARVL